MGTVVILHDDQMGQGDKVLGQRILGAFLRKGLALGDLEAIVLYNAGVRLVARGSPFVSDLTNLLDSGIEILPCGTCLDAYGLMADVVVSRPSDMDEIIRVLARADKVITL